MLMIYTTNKKHLYSVIVIKFKGGRRFAMMLFSVLDMYCRLHFEDRHNKFHTDFVLNVKMN
jgi:hypothetical protein